MKKAGTWTAFFFLLLALTSLILFFFQKEKKVYPEQEITQASESFKPDLKHFLQEVHKTVGQINVNAKHEDVDILPVDSLNVYFSKLINNNELLKGIVIYGSNMNYVIIRDNDTWVITHNTLQDSTINWKRLDDQLHFVNSWTDTYNFFMDQKSFNAIKIQALEKNQLIWRAAQSELTDMRELLFAVFKPENKTDNDVVALMFKTTDLSTQFYHVLMFDKPMVTILTTTGSRVTPINTKDPKAIADYDTLENKVAILYKMWQEKKPDQPYSYSFPVSGQFYWSRIDTVSTLMGVKAFCITVSQEDLIQTKKKTQQAFLYAAIMFVLFALFAYLTSIRKKTNGQLSETNNFKPLADTEIKEIISKGETEFIEFKSSLRWDFREEKVNKVLEEVILKSIAAFSNAKGGILMIGVNDDHEIIGLNNDINTFKKQTIDYFELHLRKLINNQYGIKYSNGHILMQFPKIEGKTICVIQIASGNTALYLKTKDKQGREVEKFYVRSGNASHEMTSLKEIQDYIKQRFQGVS